ncbi:hypothetical protein HMPREF0061_1837 [Aerococcus viridans ATCC 11563 = CCUG 4311]|uniref:Uncharacterized protein n=1 Tax=Aerococcus viridans (strain ATCC 11563 / DSM 20340 / CCUG 4311 / JCM 20461 / NBRC 12219 / NCTC 8251 / M1) TaxID=655812 RepID=A0ABN0A6I7_AERVM|nr:hypothetical protein HMPREF0061_1837 [Aerococcus viridans ATCC 11563 = CCUG 4311]
MRTRNLAPFFWIENKNNGEGLLTFFGLIKSFFDEALATFLE